MKRPPHDRLLGISPEKVCGYLNLGVGTVEPVTATSPGQRLSVPIQAAVLRIRDLEPELGLSIPFPSHCCHRSRVDRLSFLLSVPLFPWICHSLPRSTPQSAGCSARF